MAGKNEKRSANTILIDFVQKNRKVLVIGLACLVGAIIALVAFFSIRDYLRSRALSQVEQFSLSYNDIIYLTDPDEQTQLYLMNSLLEELENFQKKNSGYAAARAYAISAAIYADTGNWASAENAWSNAAKAAGKSYFAPIAYFNAASAAEEQNHISRAIELYNKAVEFGNSFPSAPRAQFSIGRLYETQGSLSDALNAYQTLVNDWPQDQVWVNLAHSRILSINAILGR